MPGVNEVSLLVREAMQNGLAPDTRMVRNAPYAETMQNLRATPFGAVTPESITNPITNGPTPNWGTAGKVQMFRGERNRWVMGQTQGYSANSSWAASVVGATFTAASIWQGVFFLEIPFFTNGTVFLWGTSLSRVTTPTVQAAGKDNNRLLLGGMAGSVFSGTVWGRVFQQWKNRQPNSLAYTAQAWDTGWIMFGERQGGSSDRPFDALLSLLGMYTNDNQADLEGYVLSELERQQWGMCPLRYPGAVLAFHELADAPLVFGEGGVARLSPMDAIYQDVRIHPIGIAGRGCVGGDLNECVFIDTGYEAWRVRAGGMPERLRFSAHLSTLTAADVTISFDPRERTYWIADKSKGYVLDAEGKLSGAMQVFPSSLVREGNSLYGVIRDTRGASTTSVVFRTLPMDMNQRGHKMITALQVQSEDVGSLAGGFDYRYDDEGAYSTGPYTQATLGGAVFPYPRISMADGKLVVTGTVAAGATGVLQGCEVRYQAEDRTFRRGTTGTAPDA